MANAVFQKLPSQPCAPLCRGKKQHFQTRAFDPHKGNGLSRRSFGHQQARNAGQCLGNIGFDFLNLRFRQKQMGRPHGIFPNGRELMDQLRFPLRNFVKFQSIVPLKWNAAYFTTAMFPLPRRFTIDSSPSASRRPARNTRPNLLSERRPQKYSGRTMPGPAPCRLSSAGRAAGCRPASFEPAWDR